MKKITIFISIILLFGTIKSFSQEESRLLRFPTVYGENIVFSYAGDLYTVSAKGGIARKLTNDIGYEMFSKFSPDGKTIAFTGQYDGNTEVFTIPAKGGIPKRLTHTATLTRDDVSDRMGPNNIIMTWSKDGKNIVYRSRKQSFNAFVGQLFSVSVDGGLSDELPLPQGGFCSYSPDGKKLAYNRVFREFRTWKYYKGGMADNVWIYDFETKKTISITNNVSQDIMPMWHGDKIYYISDRDRIMNLFSYDINTKETKKVTNFTEYDIKFPTLGDKAIVFENGGFIYLFDIATQKAQKVKITIADDVIYGRNEIKDASKHLASYEISPDGKRMLASARGDIFTIPAKNGITRNLTQSSGAHDRNPKWSPDGKYIAYISDIGGEFEIYIQNNDGSEEAIQLTKNADTYKYKLKWSPDSKKIIWSDKMLRLQYIDIDSKKVTIVDKSKIWEYNQFEWSPDSKWITYADASKNDMTKVCLFNTETKKKHEVTEGWYNSTAPVFSKDGKYLLFVSERDFNPIYSQTEWNHAFRNMSKIYLVTLAKSTKSPFAPENDEVEISENEKEEKSDEKEEKSEATVIDIDGIADRVVALPLRASNYFNINALSDKVYFYERYFGGKELKLKCFDLKGKKETEIASNMAFKISSNGKKMLVKKGKSLSIIDLPSAKATLKESIDLSGLKIKVNLKEEWKQIYNESWRQMRDFFYVANMHGVNWKAMHDKYAVMLPYVNNRNDLNYLIGELIGELNVGHAYVSGGDKPHPKRISTGLLGASLSRHSNGYYKIDKILDGENWSKTLVSPLKEIKVNINEGDYIIAVNGKSTKDMNDIYESLVGMAGKQVELVVNSKPETSGSRKVLVKPISDESKLYYFNWVRDNIKKVNEATNGQVGYIHVPDMGKAGLVEFVKYFYPQLSKKALIIDDRGNGGGNVSPMLIERLRRELTRSKMIRNVEEHGQIPAQMILGPKVLLINQYSASDGDLFPYSFKKHKLGKVIGVRSWGGVVGIRGSLPFIDGANMTRPEFASYSGEKSEWIIEGYGVDPDIEVINDPAKEYAGEDEQLNKAIEIILEELKNFKKLPDIPDGPDKSK